MFNNLANDPAATSGPKKEVDDIFSETDKLEAPTSGAPSPFTPTPAATGAKVEARAVGLAAEFSEHEEKKGSKTVKRLAFVFIVLGLLGAGAYFVFNNFLVASEPVVSETTLDQTLSDKNADSNEPLTNSVPTTVTPIDSSVDEAGLIATTSVTELVTATSTAVDSDSDGLLDSEEAQLGVNPLQTDTDGDSVNDYDEVKVYQTNPLVADTDGDGYSDGVEINGGYNPNGSGKLIR